MKLKIIIAVVCLSCITLFAATSNRDKVKNQLEDKNKLVIVWSSPDSLVAERMVLMYSHASIRREWWKDVTIVIWGPSAKLVAENKKIQEKLKQMAKDGVEIRACRACSDAFGVTEKLEELNYDVCYMGEPLTEYLKSDTRVLTF